MALDLGVHSRMPRSPCSRPADEVQALHRHLDPTHGLPDPTNPPQLEDEPVPPSPIDSDLHAPGLWSGQASESRLGRPAALEAPHGSYNAVMAGGRGDGGGGGGGEAAGDEFDDYDADEDVSRAGVCGCMRVHVWGGGDCNPAPRVATSRTKNRVAQD